jgi:hypothetical protein
MAALARRFGTVAPFGRVRGVKSMGFPTFVGGSMMYPKLEVNFKVKP